MTTHGRASLAGWKIADEYERAICAKAQEAYPDLPQESLEKLLAEQREALAHAIAAALASAVLWPSVNGAALIRASQPT